MKFEKIGTKELKVLSEQAENLRAASPRRRLCAHCSLARSCRTPYIFPFVPLKWTRRLLVISSAPDYEDAEILARQMLESAGYQPRDVAFAYTVRCAPPKRANPNMTQIRACRPFLLETIRKLRPRMIILLGEMALRAVLNAGSYSSVTEQRGKELKIANLKGRQPLVYVTYHPAAILHGAPAMYDMIVEDLRRPTLPKLEWPALASPLQGTEIIGFDTEFTPEGEITDWGFAGTEHAYAVEGSDNYALHRPYNLPRAAKILAGHSVAQDVDFLIQRGLAKREWVTGVGLRDSLLLARMHNENRNFKGGYGLENLLRSFFNVAPWKHKTESISKTDSTQWGDDLRRERVRLDAWASVTLVQHLLPMVRGPVELTHRINQVLHRIELTGAYVSMRTYNALASRYGREVKRTHDLLLREAMKLGVRDYSPTKDDQTREILFERLGLTPVAFTEKREEAKVDALTLRQYKDEHRFVQLLYEFNKADKIHSTYIEGPERAFEPCELTGYRWMPVHLYIGPRTFRRASRAPNMQNWPPEVRAMIRSRFRRGKILDLDFSKLEILLMAWAAGEERLMEFFTKSPNGYIEVAQRLFGKTVEEGTKDYRVVKAIILGTNYNKQAKALAESLWTEAGVRLHPNRDRHDEITARVRKQYLQMFPGLTVFMKKQERELLRTGCAVTATGRVRHLPVRDGEDTPHYWHLRNEAINFPIQGLAGDVTGCAMLDIENALLREYRLDIIDYHKALIEKDWPEMPLLMNEVHDELVFDMPERNRKRDTELIIETMRAVPTLRRMVRGFDVPLNVGSKLADCWTK